MDGRCWEIIGPVYMRLGRFDDAVRAIRRTGERFAKVCLPIGILASLIICTVLYVLMSGVLTGMLEYPKLNDAAPVAAALQAHAELRWLTIPVVFGKRGHGQSKWAFSLFSRWRTISNMVRYIFDLRFRSVGARPTILLPAVQQSAAEVV